MPAATVIDSLNETTLSDEYLLSSSNTLKLIKRYQNGGAAKVFIKANHPTADACKDLLLKTNAELKKIVNEQSLECSDKTKNSKLRKSIWRAQDDLQLAEVEIDTAKNDSKDIWEKLKNYMPLYSLFQSDRKNSDGDSEVQDPMRLAVKEILGDPEIQADLSRIANTAYKAGKPTVTYIRLNRDRTTTTQQIILTEYVRHQIHHPENTSNPRFTDAQLKQSIEDMRAHIQANLRSAKKNITIA